LTALIVALIASGCTDPETNSTPPPTVANDASAPMDQGVVDDSGPAPDMASTPDSALPDAGPPEVHVGYRETALTYTPRGAEDARTISISLWYPTHDTEGGFTAYQSIFVRDDVLSDAAPAIVESAPVLLFSHGRCGFSQYAYFLTEHFARAGWLVASADHTGDMFNGCENTAAIYEERPQDVSAMLDFLQALPEDDPLFGAASEDVALVGHSFGGYTSLVVAGARFAVDHLVETCDPEASTGLCHGLAESEARLRAGYHDPRIKALVPIAAGDYGVLREGIRAIEVPTLFMTANFDLNNPDEVDGDPIWAQLDGPEDRRVRFDRAGHFSFTSLCGFIGPLGENNGCSEETIPVEELHPIINEYVMAFLRLHLLGDVSGQALVDGEVSLREEVTVVRPEAE